MPRRTVLTPRMEAEIAVAEVAKQYAEAADSLQEYKRAKVRAAGLVADAERNLAHFSKLCDEAYVLEQDLGAKLRAAEDEFFKLDSEFKQAVSAKLLIQAEEENAPQGSEVSYKVPK